MVNPAEYRLYSKTGERIIHIEPVFEEITGGDLFATGRYILTEESRIVGEIRFDGELFEWDGNHGLDDESIFEIVKFIREYNEPELSIYMD